MIEYELVKVSTGEFDDEDKDDERPLTPEEWKELQRMAMEDMDHIQYPQIPYEDIPEQNRSVPDAFEDAFPDDDDDPDLTKAISVFKQWFKKEHPFTEGMRRQEEEQETLHSGKGSWNAGIETGPVAERMSKPRQQRLNQRKDDPTYERRLRAAQEATRRKSSKLDKALDTFKTWIYNKGD